MRDNFRMRVSMGRLSPQGSMMVFESPVVGTSIPRGCSGRATTINDENRPVEVQTFRTPDPRKAVPGGDEAALLDRLRPPAVSHDRLSSSPPRRNSTSTPATRSRPPTTSTPPANGSARSTIRSSIPSCTARPTSAAAARPLRRCPSSACPPHRRRSPPAPSTTALSSHRRRLEETLADSVRVTAADLSDSRVDDAERLAVTAMAPLAIADPLRSQSATLSSSTKTPASGPLSMSPGG